MSAPAGSQSRQPPPIDELIETPLVRSSSGVWTRPEQQDFAYSDGAGPEAYVESAVAAATDLSSDSEELEARVFDWASEYHLSRTRAQLLKAFRFDPDQRVLEVGCGCGAITRFLGERFAEVVAIEGSPARARIARSRTRDLTNVAVVNSPFQEIRFRTRFDLVFCIGVFEYSRTFVDAPDPYAAILEHFGNCLTERGTLVLAIENQFGLKYFSGSREDHTTVPYDGLEGYPRYRDKARTFGYRELHERLGTCFPHREFFYPYPDYKVPECVLAERFLDVPHVAELIGTYRARDYPDGARQTFDECLALLELERNRQLPFFANSFLVVAGKAPIDPAIFPYLGVHYSSARRPRYQTVTHFLENDEGTIVVEKQRVHEGAGTDPDADAGQLRLHAGTSPWTGTLSIQTRILQRIKDRRLDLAGIFAPATDWLAYVNQHAYSADGRRLLPGTFVDCTWKNCYLVDDRVEFIDREWEWREPIPREVLAVRAIYRFLYNAQMLSDVCAELRVGNRRALIRDIGAALGVEPSSADIDDFIELESRFLAAVHGQAASRVRRRLRLGLARPGIQANVERLFGIWRKIRRKLRYLRTLATERPRG